MNLTTLPTEQHRSDLLDLDLRTTAQQVELMLADQQEAIGAVVAAREAIVRAVDAIVERLASGSGRLIYVGAGTAGRLGLLDASECPPTFDSERVLALMAGGGAALASAREAAEDDVEAAEADLKALTVGAADVVVGIAASGRTPYTIAAIEAAAKRGALTVGVSCNPDTELARRAQLVIELLTGPELIAGSTRLKAGTAQKVVLNTLSTLTMVQLGKTFGNLMVHVRDSNDKLRHRIRQMVIDATGADEQTAEAALTGAQGDPRVAIVAVLADVEASVAAARLQAADGRIRAAIGDR